MGSVEPRGTYPECCEDADNGYRDKEYGFLGQNEVDRVRRKGVNLVHRCQGSDSEYKSEASIAETDEERGQFPGRVPFYRRKKEVVGPEKQRQVDAEFKDGRCHMDPNSVVVKSVLLRQ